MTAKYATNGTFGNLMRDPHFWAPAVAMTAGVAATGAASAVQKLVDARRQAGSYKEMLNLHPQLKTRDQTMVRRIFGSLHNVNPVMARDPMIAGGWVDNIMESGGLEPRLMSQALMEGVKDLAQIRSHISQATQRETSAPKAIGAGVSRMVEHGFGRGKELEREHGDLAAAHKQIKDIQESGARDKVRAYGEKVEKNLFRVAQKTNLPPDQLLHAVAQGAFKGASSPGAKLIAACRG